MERAFFIFFLLMVFWGRVSFDPVAHWEQERQKNRGKLPELSVIKATVAQKLVYGLELKMSRDRQAQGEKEGRVEVKNQQQQKTFVLFWSFS